MSSGAFIQIEPHTQHKYNILSKYLNVCKTFNNVYNNFVYVDTHGGSGQVLFKQKGQLINGSPLIAANWNPNTPCHIVEIDPPTYACLCGSTRLCSNIKTYNGDCNTLIHSILGTIPKWKKFVFCFVDPSSLVYRSANGEVYDQLTADTIRIISQYPRSELLLNFPLESILRCTGDFFNNPTESRAIANGQRVTTYMGSETWHGLKKTPDRREFLELFLNEMLDLYPYKGAILIRSEGKNLPLYYLIYATHNMTAAKIMRDIMKKEGDFPIHQDISTGIYPTIDEVYPLERYIFEKE